MKTEWANVCRESRAAYPQFYKQLRALKRQHKRGEITDAQCELAIVKEVQKVIGDRPQARTFWLLKKRAARLSRAVRREARALEHGMRSTKAPEVRAGLSETLTESEREYVEKLIRDIGGRRAIHVKACWRNAQRLILADTEKRLRYWECGFPIPHAWVTINGKVVDVTHDAAVRWLKCRGITAGQTSHKYRGVVVNRRRVLPHILRTSRYDAVLGQTLWADELRREARALEAQYA